MKKSLWVTLVSACPMMFSSATWAAFSVNFNDGLGASNFTTVKSASSTVNYAFDYSTYHYYASPSTFIPFSDQGEIPQAPNSPSGSPKIGMRLSARTLYTDPGGYASALANFSSTGYYRMNFDMWINYNGPTTGGDGSTEFTFFGVNSSGTGFLKNVSAFASTAEGYAMTATGEGGSGSDYRIYYTDPTDDGPTYSKSNATWSGTPGNPGNPDNNTNLFWSGPGLFGANESPGAPGKSWVSVTVEQIDPTHVNWSFNNILVATLTLAETADGLGNPFIGFGDTIAGAPGAAPDKGVQPAGDSLADAFVLIDNLVITDTTPTAAPVPEPSAAALATGAAAATLLGRRRR